MASSSTGLHNHNASIMCYLIEKSGHLRCTMRKREQPYLRRSTVPLHCNAGHGTRWRLSVSCVVNLFSEAIRFGTKDILPLHTYIVIKESLIFLIEIIDWILINWRMEPNSPSSLDKPTRWSTLNNSFFRLIYRCGVWIPTPPGIDLHGLVMLRQSLIQSIQHVPKLGVVFKTKRRNNRQLGLANYC